MERDCGTHPSQYIQTMFSVSAEPRNNQVDLVQGGMEILCSLCFTENGDLLKTLSNLFNSKSLNQPDELKFCVKIEMVVCEPASKKAKVDVTTADSNEAMQDDVWVRCDKHILKNVDKEIIESVVELTDKCIQYSQYLIKNNFKQLVVYA